MGKNWEIGVDTYTLQWVKQTASGKLLHNTENSASSVMTWRGGMGRGRDVQEGGHRCMHTADSHRCAAETNTGLLYSNKNKKSDVKNMGAIMPCESISSTNLDSFTLRATG